MKVIDASTTWLTIGTGIEICEQLLKPHLARISKNSVGSSKIKVRPNAPYKQLKLFSEQEIYNNYRFQNILQI